MLTWAQRRKKIVEALTAEEQEDISTMGEILTKITERCNEMNMKPMELKKFTGVSIEEIEKDPSLSTLLQVIRHLGLKLKVVKM